jgi:hypothetical protein
MSHDDSPCVNCGHTSEAGDPANLSSPSARMDGFTPRLTENLCHRIYIKEVLEVTASRPQPL